MKLNQTANQVHNQYLNNPSAQFNGKTQEKNEPELSTENNMPAHSTSNKQKNEYEDEQSLADIQDKAIEQANKSLKQYNRVIERTVHPITHTLMYTVKNENTNEVIAEFPPRKIQDMVAKMWEMAGMVVDAKV